MAALLLDENMPRSAGEVLAAAGHDVAFAAVISAGADDAAVLELARDQGRVLVTFDADFGDLVYRQGAAPPQAIVYVRLDPIDARLAGALVASALSGGVEGQFIVCGRQSTRRRLLPKA